MTMALARRCCGAKLGTSPPVALIVKSTARHGGRCSCARRKSHPVHEQTTFTGSGCETRSPHWARRALSVIGASVTGAVLENVWLTVYRQKDRALVGMRLVEGAHPPPHILAGAADAIMIVQRAFERKGLLDLGMPVHRQRRTGTY